MNKNVTHLVIGVISGIVATGPMTAVMTLLHRRLPHHERYPLPPREITMKLAHKAGIAEHMSHESRTAMTLLGHFAYGAAAGALYSVVSEPHRSPWSKGLITGLIVWAASYLGLMPAAGVLEPATEHPKRRNLLMIAAHLVWGASLSGMAYILSDEVERSGSEPFSAPHTPLRDAMFLRH